MTDVQVLVLAGVAVVALAFSAILIRRGHHDGATLDRHGLDGLQRIYRSERPAPPSRAGEGPGPGITPVRVVAEPKGLEGR